MSNSTEFTYKALEKKCPSCGDALLLTGSYLFCQREHGARIPSWAWIVTVLPVATRTARVGRFTIEGEGGFWRVLSHMDKELLHDGPKEGSVVASIFRYNSRIPTAVAFVRGKKPRGKKKVEPTRAVRKLVSKVIIDQTFQLAQRPSVVFRPSDQ